MKHLLLVVTVVFVATALPFAVVAAAKPVGTQGVVGTLANPKTVSRLEITEPGVYENYLVDAQGKGEAPAMEALLKGGFPFR